MATFFHLPRELRDQIYGYLIHAEKKRPDISQSFNQLVDPRLQRNELAQQLTNPEQAVLYLPQDDLNFCTPLLLVNRQIHAEVSESLCRIRSHLTYSLDIIILDEILLLPTWLSVPVQRTSVDTVNVTFRIAGSFQQVKENHYNGPYARFPWFSGFQAGDGSGGEAMLYQLYEIIQRFIKHGPIGQARDTETSKHVTVKCINIEVLTPEDVPLEKFAGPQSSNHPRHMRRRVQGGVLHPLFLAGFVSKSVRMSISGGHQQYFNYGKLLFEHVDKIVLSKDGVEFDRYDVAEYLQKLVVEERHISTEQMRIYKEQTWQLRKARGLKVLED